METIRKIISVPTQGAYYYEDVSRLQESPVPEEARWNTPGKTPGFRYVREVADVVSVGIVSSSGEISWGDCVGVSYSGKSGREGVFRHQSGINSLNELAPLLVGKPLDKFRELVPLFEKRQMHKAVHYGLTQALLRGVATTSKCSVTETICREWKLPLPTRLVPLQGSSGNNRQTNADKMIINRLEGLPHGQIDTPETQLGKRGEILLDYARWLKKRIDELGDHSYFPTIHLDVHGAIGKIFGGDPTLIASYLRQIENSVQPYALRFESVLLGQSKQETISRLKELRQKLSSLHSKIELVADEWANTKEDILDFADSGAVQMIHLKMPDLGGIQESIETVLALKSRGIKSLLGGSCIETEISALVSVHIALATQPTALLAKPGMGIDEAIMLCRNEMQRTLHVFSGTAYLC